MFMKSHLGSNSGSKEAVIMCLTQKPADDILNRELGVSPPGINFNPFVVTIDGKTIREEPKKSIKKLANRAQGWENQLS